jgi:RHS repeat-associated protein
MADGSGTQNWTYDSLGRMTAHTNGASQTVNYGYSIRGELLTLGYPGKGTVVRSYGDDGELNSVTDWNSHTTSFDYDKNGALTTTTYPNGVVGTNTYDNAGRVTNIGYVKSAATLANYAYGRTAGGDVNAETDSGSSASANKTYTYNTLGQLASENSSSFGYDTADNLTSINGATQTYDDANQVLTSGTKSFGYDQQGNRVSSTVSSTTTNLGYDQASRLKSFGSSATYAYDGGGLRTSKTVSSTTSSFIYDTAEGLPLITDDGTNAYVYGPQGLIEQVNGSTATYVHQDQLGSTRLLTDSSGAVVGTYQFDAYGNTTSHTGTAATPMQYAGQYLDSESGLYWMRARYYDPSTGQFVSRDPIASVTRDAYAYAGGMPVNATDPSGLCFSFGCKIGETGWGQRFMGRQAGLWDTGLPQLQLTRFSDVMPLVRAG